jgi:periplasmic protein TonB
MERTFISTGERIRNYLGVALLLSLMLNAFVIPLYPNLTTPQTYVKPNVFSIIRAARVSTPPPKPTPPPSHRVARPSQSAAKPPAVTPPKTKSTVGVAEPPYVRQPNAVPSGAPGSGTSPVSDATTGTATEPACSNPNQEASVLDSMSPSYPDSARDLGLQTVSVFVQVTIDAQGRLVDARIYRSSNNAAIDQEALRAARGSKYAPKIVNCAPVEGTYLFHADFEPN